MAIGQKLKTTQPNSSAPTVKAVGDKAATGMPVTPGPDRRWGGGNEASNRWGGPSSLTPNNSVEAVPNLVQNPDPVMDQVKAIGVARSFDVGNTNVDIGLARAPQTRVISDKQATPDSFGMSSNRSRQPSSNNPERIPGACDFTPATPVRKPV